MDVEKPLTEDEIKAREARRRDRERRHREGKDKKPARRLDVIGTRFCVPVYFDSLADRAVRVRDRDPLGLARVPLVGLHAYLGERLAGACRA